VSSLAESNPHLRDPERLAEIIAHSAWESSVFEGARGLPRPKRPSRRRQRPRRSIASTKKAASGS
jgi:hypothetical protein